MAKYCNVITLYNGCNYLSMLGCKLIHVSKKAPGLIALPISGLTMGGSYNLAALSIIINWSSIHWSLIDQGPYSNDWPIWLPIRLNFITLLIITQSTLGIALQLIHQGHTYMYQAIIGSDNGLLSVQRPAIIWTPPGSSSPHAGHFVWASIC